MSGAVPYGAPWKMYRLPNTATPTPDDSVDVPGPDVIGDQMMWSVYNDADPSKHTNDAGNSSPLGIEIQQTTFGFNRQGAPGKTVFIKYKLKNKGTQTLNEMYISQWADPDLGGSAGYTDDLVGCDTLPDGTNKPRSMGYVYNSTNNDGGYGATPPALGYDFFQGPKVNGTPLPLTSFAKYINGTDPASPEETYHYMQGLTSDSSDVVDPFGKVTKFMHAGDPVSPGPGSWLDTNPADRRFFMSSGPFTMAPGDSQEVVVGIVVGVFVESATTQLDSTRSVVQRGRLPDPDPTKVLPELDRAMDVLRGQLVDCTSQFSTLTAPEKAEELRGYGIGRGQRVQTAIQSYRPAAAKYFRTTFQQLYWPAMRGAGATPSGAPRP